MSQKIVPDIMIIRYILLHIWDPIGISSYESASDEYDSYGNHIIEMMRIGANFDDIKTYLYNSARTHIGLNYPGLLEKSELAARRILEVGGVSH